MKLIDLDNSEKQAVVDDEDFDRVNQYKWKASKKHGIWYASCSQGGQMGRFILSAPKGLVTDHINHDALDNRRVNLRLCTVWENRMNSRSDGGSSSKYKGVYLYSLGRWRARIMYEGIMMSLGVYESEDEAALVYNKIAEKLFGEFACLNDVS